MINRIANWSIQIENSKVEGGHIKFIDKNLKKIFLTLLKIELKSIYLQINMRGLL